LTNSKSNCVDIMCTYDAASTIQNLHISYHYMHVMPKMDIGHFFW